MFGRPKNAKIRLFLPAALPLCALFSGCANPGPPRPPSLHLPKPVTALAAQRTGNRVRITFTVAADTTDGGKPLPPFTAILCRDQPQAGPTAIPNCTEVVHFPVAPGPAQTTDDLPTALTSGPPALLAYRVNLLNQKNHTAGPSAPAYALAGAAPAPAGPLVYSSRRNGALIAWQPADSTPAAPMQLSRTLVATAAGPLAPQPAKKKSKAPTPAASKKNRPRETTLIARDSTPGRDPGGMIDRSIQDGDTLTYTAQRVLTVQLPVPSAPPAASSEKKSRSPFAVPGQAPGKPSTQPTVQSFDLRGDPSPALTVVFHDTIPPTAPTGLAAIPGGGFGQPPSIDLSWLPSPETDLLGYNVYRADAPPGQGQPGPTFKLLNPAPLPGPAYRDLTAQPGHPYLYRITAIDQRHNESAPTPASSEHLQ